MLAKSMDNQQKSRRKKSLHNNLSQWVFREVSPAGGGGEGQLSPECVFLKDMSPSIEINEKKCVKSIVSLNVSDCLLS